MTSFRDERVQRWVGFGAVPVLAVVLGIAVAVASSPASLTRGQHALGSPAPIQASPSPSAAASPSPPTVTEPGILGGGPHLVAAGATSLAAFGPNLAAASADGGKTWTILRPPSKAVGVAIDPGNPSRGITGGNNIQVTLDGGGSWKAPATAPPGPAGFQPLLVSPFDGAIWFLVHGGKLLRTRDAGQTWRDIAGLPALSNPVLVPGQVFGQFYLGSGGSVFELVDNGQQVLAQPSLPGGVSVNALAAVGGGQATLVARASNGGLQLLTRGAWTPLTAALSGPVAAGANGIVVVGDGGTKLGVPAQVAYSFDGGSTWRSAVGLPYDQTVEALAGQPSSTTLFAYCYGGDVYASADGGASWSVYSRALRNRAG